MGWSYVKQIEARLVKRLGCVGGVKQGTSRGGRHRSCQPLMELHRWKRHHAELRGHTWYGYALNTSSVAAEKVQGLTPRMPYPAVRESPMYSMRRAVGWGKAGRVVVRVCVCACVWGGVGWRGVRWGGVGVISK